MGDEKVRLVFQINEKEQEVIHLSSQSNVAKICSKLFQFYNITSEQNRRKIQLKVKKALQKKFPSFCSSIQPKKKFEVLKAKLLQKKPRETNSTKQMSKNNRKGSRKKKFTNIYQADAVPSPQNFFQMLVQPKKNPPVKKQSLQRKTLKKQV